MRYARDRATGLLLPDGVARRGVCEIGAGSPGFFSSAAGGGAVQPAFANVELLLHMDGSDGSTTFTDSSSHGRTVTANGDAQLDTAQSKFGTASGLFDGTGDYLTATINSLNIRTQAFCIESWMRFNTSVGTHVLFAGGPIGESFYGVWVSGTFYVGDGSDNPIAVANSPSTATWHHCAVTFTGTVYRFFVNGVLIGSTTTLLANTTITQIYLYGRPGQGWYLNGWADDARVVIGEAVYTGAFTPPTSPHPDS